MLEKVSVDLKNCYGIDAVSHVFDFSNKNMPVLIYAPNGVMKTSFAKTLRDYSEGRDPRDIFFPNRESKFSIKNGEGNAVEAEALFVIDSIDEKYQSKRISTLLASEDLKARYDEIFGSISERTESLFRILKTCSGISTDIELVFSQAFKVRKEDLLVALARLEREVRECANSQFSKLKYKTLFSEKVIDFLAKKDVEKLIQDYARTYEQILDSSLYFKKGVFNHSNAETIAKNLKANGWFEGGHTVNLKHDNERNEISTEDELVAAIETEKQKILTDPKLSAMFKKVDAALTTVELRAFRDYLIQHPFVVPELSDMDAFKQKVWISYLVENQNDYANLIKEYDASKDQIKIIINLAEKEQTQWENVISLFNNRFSVPFEVRVENKGDAVLNVAAPQITFYFTGKEGDIPTKTDRMQLDSALSNGEKRALYILNIIFEIEARRRNSIETLVVLDDIADSFDYKNKYAIIEYLSDIRDDENFKLIILTHNYDFYRTIRGRLRIYGENKLLSNRANGSLQLIEDKISENPFEDWKNNLSDPVKLIASVPFVRNLAAYVGNQDIFLRLTSLLHIKKETPSILVSDLYGMYSKILTPASFENFGQLPGSVFDLINNACVDICGLKDDNLELEQKIMLSIGIRLAAENCLIQKIQDAEFVAKITKNQTGRLIQKYKTLPNCDQDILKVMKRVSLMTPENIHLNSFMFEPILDMSGHHLKSLFDDVTKCN